MNTLRSHAHALYIFRPDHPALLSNREHLSIEEKTTADRFKFPADALRWSVCRGTIRAILSHHLNLPPKNLPIHPSPSGKPGFPRQWQGPEFNLSHCHDLALFGISSLGIIGVDLEPLSRAPDLLGCEGPFLHPTEIQSLSSHPTTRGEQLLAIWTAKEAFLKALGTGFLQNPTEIRIDFALRQAIADTPISGLEALRLHRVQAPDLSDHLATVALPSTLPLPEVMTWPLESTPVPTPT